MVHLQRAIVTTNRVEAHDGRLASMFWEQRDPVGWCLHPAADEHLGAVPGHSTDGEDHPDETTRRSRGVPTFKRRVDAMMLTRLDGGKTDPIPLRTPPAAGDSSGRAF